MILKDRILEEIEQLSPTDLIVIQNLLLALKKRKPLPTEAAAEAVCAKTRRDLASYHGNLSDAIIGDRADRL